MSNANRYDTIIVGAGLAGLACGIRLRKKGLRVLIIEKNDSAGGKLAEFSSEGFRWDNGPSLFTQPELVDELFMLWDKNPRDYFSYTRQAESCRYHFADNSSFIFKGGRTETLASLSGSIGEDDLNKLVTYAETAEKDYQNIGQFFLERKQPRIRDFFSKDFIRRYPFFATRRMRISLNKYNEQFSDERLTKVFNRFGTYNGSNPYQMSGLYSIISSLEMNGGTFFPTKGMREIPEVLYQLATEVGVDFQFNKSPQITKSTEGYSCLAGDQCIESKNIVCAIDHLTFYRDVFSDNKSFEKYAKQERSTSGLVFYWGINTKIDELGLHNIIFCDDYEGEFNTLFGKRECSQKPTIYIHVSSIVCKDDAPENGQNLFVMINTPAYQNPSEAYRVDMKNYIINQFRKTYQVDISNSIVSENYWDNQKISDRTGSFLGALYGASSNAMTAALNRHPNVVSKHRHMYFCGGTVHPGGGIPLVLTSAKIVSNSIN